MIECLEEIGLRADQRFERIENEHRELKRDVDSHVANLKQKVHDVGLSIAKIEGALNIQKKSPHPWVTPVISFAGAAILLFWGWIANTVVQQGKDLSAIRQALPAVGITVSANNPDNPKARKEAESALAEAKKSSTPLPSLLVENAGKSFIEASKKTPDAWPVALDFASYRSTLNYSARPSVINEPQPKDFNVRYDSGGHPGSVTWHGVTEAVSAARWDLIGRDQNKDQTSQPAWLLAQGGTVDLTGHYVRHVVFQGVEVHYSGGSVILDDVIFVNCSFVFDNAPNSRELGQRILAASNITFRSVG